MLGASPEFGDFDMRRSRHCGCS